MDPVTLPQVTVTPQPPAPAPAGTPQQTPEGYPYFQTDPNQAGGDPWAAFPDALSTQPAQPQAQAATTDPWAAFPDQPSGQPKPGDEISTGGAAARGLEHGLSLGSAPALHGLSEAAQPSLEKFAEKQGVDPEKLHVAPHVRAAMGLAEKLTSWITGEEDPAVRDAYERGRKAALENEQAAQEQHPGAYLGGVLAGTVMVPGFGQIRAAGLGGRILQGAVQGGVAGGLYGAGEATSEGKSLPEIGSRAATGAAVGAPLGGAVLGAVGPRAVTAGAGARAARTAEELGTNLPAGVASDSRQVQDTTSKFMSLPLVGERIRGRTRAAGEAAGQRVEDIATTMAGGAPSRSVADTVARPAVQGVIDANRQAIDAAYGGLRGMIDADMTHPMPHLTAALDRVRNARHQAGWADSEQGLEQFANLVRGASFNGAQRARVDARNAGNVLTPHPGYNAADFNMLSRAITADMGDMVRASARGNPQQALQAFQEADRTFGQMADFNRQLHRLANAQGEGAIAKLLGSAKEKGGNLQLLQRLRATMPPDEFQQIGGTLLAELGWHPAQGEFSLSKFSTEWNKLSPGARNVLFSPEHARQLDDIAAMGDHIKHALATASTSHSSNWLAFIDILKDVVLLSLEAGAHGGVTPGPATLAGAGSTAVMYAWAYALGNPARVASLGAFTRAYRAVSATLGQPTPARMVAFKLATRNLANTLGIPVEKMMETVTSRMTSIPRAEEPDQNETVQKP